MKYELEIKRKFNGGYHVFGLCFDDLKDAKQAMKALEKSTDVTSVALVEKKAS